MPLSKENAEKLKTLIVELKTSPPVLTDEEADRFNALIDELTVKEEVPA